ncbi:MAG TPA: glycoside hydrolase family 130 protein [Acidimicrobiales bacterium]|nr:glycoside hydrolase family 130 protein [Acidimicrobiales bacterium]
MRLELEGLLRRFGGRHRDLLATFSHHADRIGNRLDPGVELSNERRLLLGATFTHEYSVEAASLCNPSIVADPDQSAVPADSLRFIMSVRGIGEGHRSSIGFRAGTVGPTGDVVVDEPGRFPTLATVESGIFDRKQFAGRLRATGEDTESAIYVLDHLADTFRAQDLESQLAVLAEQDDTRSPAHTTAALLRSIAACSYTARFPPDTMVSERVLAPAMAAESRGMEDARFVRFVDDDGSVTYYATYTAFDGVSISQQLLCTTDFLRFAIAPMIGPAASNKGLALFPRRIGGRFAALSRYDRETNAVAYSDTLSHWGDAVTCQTPDRPWEVIQLGNCGSPIETDQGWLVLTHGVGPMRTYSVGAMLLDLDDPAHVIRTLPEPLLTPGEDERDGYVPNVVYSCGALTHGETLVIPYGIADTSIGIATIRWPELLDAMVDP